jgi:hypothetical protein
MLLSGCTAIQMFVLAAMGVTWLRTWGGREGKQIRLWVLGTLICTGPIPMAAWSKARVCGSSPTGTEFESRRGRDVCLVSVMCRQVEVSASG